MLKQSAFQLIARYLTSRRHNPKLTLVMGGSQIRTGKVAHGFLFHVTFCIHCSRFSFRVWICNKTNDNSTTACLLSMTEKQVGLQMNFTWTSIHRRRKCIINPGWKNAVRTFNNAMAIGL